VHVSNTSADVVLIGVRYCTVPPDHCFTSM